MEEALNFFKTYEMVIYILLASVGLFYARKLILAWNEYRSATFGLERENAQARLNVAASLMILVLAIIGAEFILVTFIAPSIPQLSPLITPTLNLLTTPSATLPPEAITPETTPLQPAADIPAQTPVQGCLPGQVFISSPPDGSQVQGLVDISGSATIPDFGFYKLEMKRPEELNWLTILAGNTIQPDGVLGSWNTNLLSAGVYQLSLVVSDNKGNDMPRCIVQLSITTASGTAQP